MEINLPPQGRRRGRYSDEFKAGLIEACRQPGVSTAAVALANGINANLLRRWVTQAQGGEAVDQGGPDDTASVDDDRQAAFVQIAKAASSASPVMSPTSPPSVRIEVRRGELAVTLDWPLSHVSECAALLGTVLR